MASVKGMDRPTSSRRDVSVQETGRLTTGMLSDRLGDLHLTADRQQLHQRDHHHQHSLPNHALNLSRQAALTPGVGLPNEHTGTNSHTLHSVASRLDRINLHGGAVLPCSNPEEEHSQQRAPPLSQAHAETLPNSASGGVGPGDPFHLQNLTAAVNNMYQSHSTQNSAACRSEAMSTHGVDYGSTWYGDTEYRMSGASSADYDEELAWLLGHNSIAAGTPAPSVSYIS